jgi:hypothetical protein
MVVYGNVAFQAAFGTTALGMPAREVMLDLPVEAFALLDSVLSTGRPLARWVRRGGEAWRLTCAPRIDPETGEAYGVTLHLRERSDLPIAAKPIA